MSDSQRPVAPRVPKVANAKHDRLCTLTATAIAAHRARDLLEHLQIDLVRLTAAALLLGVGQGQKACRA